MVYNLGQFDRLKRVPNSYNNVHCFDNYEFSSVFLLGWLGFCVSFYHYFFILCLLVLLFYVLSSLSKVSFYYLVNS